MINKSESIKNIGKALLDFHENMGKVYKSETNPFFKSKYADLATILTAIKEPLHKAGLAVSQFPSGLNRLTTLLVHAESGEYLESTYEMTPAKNDPQGQGSAITYQRRYALGAVLNLNIDEDDDGNQASTPVKAKATATVKSIPDAPYLCSEHGNTVKHFPAGTKNGKQYDAFYSCTEKPDGKWCKAKLTDFDHNEVFKNPETGKYEVIKRPSVEFEITTADMPQ